MVPGALYRFHSDSHGWGSAAGYCANDLTNTVTATAGNAAIAVTTSTSATNASTLSVAERWGCQQQPHSTVAGLVECMCLDATRQGLTNASVGFSASTITATGQQHIR